MRKKAAVDIETELSRCINQLLIKEPFFTHLLSSTCRIITKDVPTAAVGIRQGQVLLMVNPDFFVKGLTSTAERTAVAETRNAAPSLQAPLP